MIRGRLLIALALAALAPVAQALPLFPIHYGGNPVLNGGFEACAPTDVKTPVWGPDSIEGAHACVGWRLRTGLADLSGYLPESTHYGATLGAGGHVGVLVVEYDDRDGVLLLEQSFTPERKVTVFSGGAELLFTYRTLTRFPLGAHVTLSVPGGTQLVAAQGAPFLTFADNQWHEARFALPLAPGDDLAGLAIEFADGTPDATHIQIDDVQIRGVGLGPALHA